MTLIHSLFQDYKKARFLDINEEQFIYLIHLLPPCLVAMSDGFLDKEEWVTLKSLSKILGNELASDNMGDLEKEENLMLIYKGEIRYLLKNKDKWQARFFDALREYFGKNDASKGFLQETLDLLNKGEKTTEEERAVLETIRAELNL